MREHPKTIIYRSRTARRAVGRPGPMATAERSATDAVWGIHIFLAEGVLHSDAFLAARTSEADHDSETARGFVPYDGIHSRSALVNPPKRRQDEEQPPTRRQEQVDETNRKVIVLWKTTDQSISGVRKFSPPSEQFGFCFIIQPRSATLSGKLRSPSTGAGLSTAPATVSVPKSTLTLYADGRHREKKLSPISASRQCQLKVELNGER